MHRLRTGKSPALIALACAAVWLVACSETAPATRPGEAPSAQDPGIPSDTPTISITYDHDGENRTVSAELGVSGCSDHAFTAMAADGSSASAIFPTPDQSGNTRVTATILGEAVVAFQGNSTPEYLEDEGALRAYVVDLAGTATVIDSPPGAGADDLDLSKGVEVPATLSATLECTR